MEANASAWPRKMHGRKQRAGWDTHVSILFTEVVERNPKYLTNPAAGGDIFKKRMQCYKGIKTTYTNILSNDDVSHRGHPIIFLDIKYDMNIKITHRPCKVGVFMCRSLFQDILNVGETVTQVCVCYWRWFPSFHAQEKRISLPTLRIQTYSNTLFSQIKRRTLTLRKSFKVIPNQRFIILCLDNMCCT